MELDEMKERLEGLIKRTAVLEERSRIMSEIDKADLPAGIWTMIKGIINPTNKTN